MQSGDHSGVCVRDLVHRYYAPLLQSIALRGCVSSCSINQSLFSCYDRNVKQAMMFVV